MRISASHNYGVLAYLNHTPLLSDIYLKASVVDCYSPVRTFFIVSTVRERGREIRWLHRLNTCLIFVGTVNIQPIYTTTNLIYQTHTGGDGAHTFNIGAFNILVVMWFISAKAHMDIQLRTTHFDAIYVSCECTENLIPITDSSTYLTAPKSS